MSPRLRGRHRRTDLPAMLAALDEAVEVLDGRADPKVLKRALAVGSRAGERLRLSGEHTVVALAGSTGSGKSSLFNALAGEDLSPVGVRRPTTSKAHACVWGAEGATTLVQWLGDPRRAIEKAVWGMLPKNRLGRQMLKKLKVYAGPEHPHQAQQAKPFEITQISQ